MVRRLWQGAALVAAVLAVLYGVYQRFLAPSPEVTAAFAHRQKSEQALEQNDLNAALREVETAIAAMPAEADQWVLKGVIQSLLGQEQAAGETFAAAEAKLGSRSALLVSRGQRWLLAGRFDAALADAQAAIALDPDSIVGHLVLGQVFERTQQEWKAITAYEQAARLADAQNQPQLAVMARMQLGMIQQRPILPTPKP
jgi:Tfp pilus assembly protein PilF